MTLCMHLKDVIEDYFGKYPNTSINGLANKSGVGASTLRRILNESIKGDPSPHTVLNIASATSKEKRLSKLLSMFEGPIGQVLNEAFSSYVEVDAPHQYDTDLNDLLRDRTTYFVYKLAANRTGVTKTEITELFGGLGLEKLKKLIEAGACEDREGSIHATKKDFSMDLTIMKDHLPELVKFYQPERLDEGRNLFYTLSESLNEDGIRKIKEIQKEAVKKVYDIMNSPYFEGDIPYFTVQVCDTLDLGISKEVMQ